MLLNNILIFQGYYYDINRIKANLIQFQKHNKKSTLYDINTTKHIRKLVIEAEYESKNGYELMISFQYLKTNINELINAFRTPNVIIAHLCYHEKQKLWIVNNNDYIKKYRLIPPFALQNILLEYMQYKESAIVTDNFETIKYDRNTNKIVVNDHYLPHNELLDLIYNQTLKGKVLIDILEQFIQNYHNKCINTAEAIYSNTKEIIGNEEPTPFALFFVTFGVLGIIFIIVMLMGYI